MVSHRPLSSLHVRVQRHNAQDDASDEDLVGQRWDAHHDDAVTHDAQEKDAEDGADDDNEDCSCLNGRH